MPFTLIQKAIDGGRKLSDALTLAQVEFAAYVWNTANYTDSSITAAKLASDVPLRFSYTSPEQTITATGSLTLAHGLSTNPELIQARLICKTADVGYSIDDEVIINSSGSTPGGGTNRGLSIVPDSTNINVRFGSDALPISILNKTTGAGTTVINANWRLIIKAWA